MEFWSNGVLEKLITEFRRNGFDSDFFFLDRIYRIYWIFLFFVSGGNKEYSIACGELAHNTDVERLSKSQIRVRWVADSFHRRWNGFYQFLPRPSRLSGSR
jgi:hypothetical protein